MTTVRRATLDDVPALVDLGARFVGYSPYGDTLTWTREDLAEGLRTAIGDGVVFVAQHEERIVGLLAAIVTAAWFAPRCKAALELAWWMDPEHRGGTAALRMHSEFEAWARAQGATARVMSDLVVDGEGTAGAMLDRLGYRQVERSWIREA